MGKNRKFSIFDYFFGFLTFEISDMGKTQEFFKKARFFPRTTTVQDDSGKIRSSKHESHEKVSSADPKEVLHV